MKSLKRKFRKFKTVQPVFMANFFRSNNVMKAIATIHNQHIFRQFNHLNRILLLALSVIFWLPYSVILSVNLVKRNGKSIKIKAGKSGLIQFFEQVYYANRWFIHPRHYYYFSLWRKEYCKKKELYFLEGNAQNLFNIINKNVDLQILDDKILFHDFCKRNYLPAPEIVGIFEKGTFRNATPNVLPESDIFFKLKSGYNTRGIERWDFIGNGMYHNVSSGQFLVSAHLIDRYRKKSRRNTFFIQPRQHNHPRFDAISSPALCTIRVITAIDENGMIQIFNPVLNVPVGIEIFNHMADGGIVVCIDAATGNLLTSYKFEAKGRPVPVNLIQKPGMQAITNIPEWEKVKEIALEAHRLLAGIPVIGWDIAVTDTGPVILEGNHNIAMNFHQLPPNLPFGKTAFARILLFHLRRSLEKAG